MSFERALKVVMRAIEAEAARNPQFRADISQALVRAGELAFAETRRRPQKAFDPFETFSASGPQGLAAGLEKLAIGRLRDMVDTLNLDPAGRTGDYSKEQVIEHVVGAVKRRVERDRGAFEY